VGKQNRALMVGLARNRHAQSLLQNNVAMIE